jgi:chromate transporter
MTTYFQLFASFFKIGSIMFGGGYAMLPVLEHEVVDRRGWLSGEDLIDLFALSQCTPGVIAVNVATHTGYRERGLVGAAFSTLGVITPSIIIITIISAVLNNVADIPAVQSALSGIRVAACALMVGTMVKMWKGGIKDWLGAVIFAAVFVLTAFTDVSTVWLVLGALLIGVFSFHSKREAEK